MTRCGWIIGALLLTSRISSVSPRRRVFADARGALAPEGPTAASSPSLHRPDAAREVQTPRS